MKTRYFLSSRGSVIDQERLVSVTPWSRTRGCPSVGPAST
jgi:hypothetical protein